MAAETPGLFTPFMIQTTQAENGRTRSLVLEGTLDGAQPGQFVMVWLPGVGEKPFSLSGNAPLRLSVAAVGPFSAALAGLQAGDRIWLRGPLGVGFALKGRHALLVGGGYGAAPLAFLAREALKAGGTVRVLLGARTAAELMLEEALRGLGCYVEVATEDGSRGSMGLVTALAEQAIEQARPDGVYACGPSGMLMTLWQLCQRAGLPAQLSFEGLVRCGVGLCGSCELPEELCLRLGLAPGWLVCHDGPVCRLG